MSASIAASRRPRRRRSRSRWRSPISLDDLSALFVIGVMLLMPLLTLEIAGWAVDGDVVLRVAIIGLFLGWLLSRSRFGELTALLVGSLYGVGAVFLMAALSLGLPFREALVAVLRRGNEWALDAVGGGINTDDLVLTMLIALLFWFLAYNCAWHVFRLDRVWRAILPPGLVLVANLIFYRGGETLDLQLFFFLLMALILIVRSNLDRREWDWHLRGARVPAIVRRQFATIGIALSLLSLFFAWGMPSRDLQDRLDEFQRFLASDPIQQAAELWNRLFAPIEGEGSSTTDYYGADLLHLGGAISLGDQIVFTVEAPPPPNRHYWRSRVYERYSDGQWSPSAELRVTDRGAPVEILMDDEALGGRRLEIEQRFTVGASSSRIFYAAPQPLRIESEGRIDLLFTDKPANSSMNVSVVRPLKLLRQNESYRVSSLVSVASAQELRQASSAYPDWVSGVNLYVGAPNPRVFELASEIVRRAGAANAYDRAKAIERWLRDNIAYNETISAPPAGVDTVEWVLFDAKEGYCTYYATAMIVMLRHLGIPARLAAGFSQGTYDAELGRYQVREREAHTWVEVYFPGYGWIEFEPTAAEEPIRREGDQLENEADEAQRPEPTATASPTPSNTPSPTPTVTPPPSPTARSSEEAKALSQLQPSPTRQASPTPPPSPTPLILPTVEPPISPDAPPPLSPLQPLILIALVVILVLLILAIIALLLFWWWEWRGLGGLSPVSRAYARLERYIGLLGINMGATRTTLEKRRELQRRLPAAKEPIGAISDLYTIERYGAAERGPEQNKQYAESAEQAWYRTRGDILRRWLRRKLPFLRGD